jgi:sulfite reductase (NADPH) flavoprotein alpha-component
MTISVWRYSHLALAVSSFIFILLASVTGIILAFEPINEKFPSYKAEGFNNITVAQVVPSIKKSFDEITEINVDVNDFVIVKGIDTAGKNITAYVNPATGKIIGTPKNKNEFFESVKDFHRSLFLHTAGRLFVGITAFLLLLIAVSGTVLVIKRQRGIKRFFTKIIKENFAQYYHVVLGRLSLIPIIIIALTGTYLSMQRFDLFPEKKITHQINFDAIKSQPKLNIADFSSFKNIPLSQVENIEFPFSNDVEDYYTLKLKDKELVVNQFTGDVLNEVAYSKTTSLTNLSLNLHTGRKSILWSIILAIACINILFFIYSGFAITLKRTANKIKNKYKADDAEFIILIGSENGSTLGFAKAVHQLLLSNNQTSYLTELNNYKNFAKAKQLVVLTSTYGLGDAPVNAKKFSSLINKIPQQQNIQFAVVGFGSHAYADFCAFAFEVNNILTAQTWAKPLLEIHTVNDKSPQEFNQWFTTWSQKLQLPQMALPESLQQKPTGLVSMMVAKKTTVSNADETFIIQLKTSWRNKFNSGDLLAVYPENNFKERLYSIGKIDKHIQLCVKLHQHGIGSNYLNDLKVGDNITANIISNQHFQFPQKASAVIMISNGTGIAPFLGMIDENDEQIDCRLYCGFRDRSSFQPYQSLLEKNIQSKKLTQLNIAYSREGNKEYVKNLLEKDASFVASTLTNKGVIMLCGSLAMQHDVLAFLEIICKEKNNKPLSFYQSHKQILMDCY